jgi:hypothetical protein
MAAAWLLRCERELDEVEQRGRLSLKFAPRQGGH